MNGWKPLASVTLVAALVMAPLASMGAYADEAAPPDGTAVVTEEPAAPVEEVAPTEAAVAPTENTVTAPKEESSTSEALPEEAPPAEAAAVQDMGSSEAPTNAAVAAPSAPVQLGRTVAPTTSDHNDGDYESKWVFVCKYVGKPGVDERLQTGRNPIAVSVNSIEHNRWNGEVPGWFSDAQNRSYVIAYDPSRGGGQAGEPTVNDCPRPQSGTAMATVQVTPPSCLDLNGSVVLTHSHSSVTSVTRNGVPVTWPTSGTIAAPLPGDYVVVLTAKTGYTFGGNATKTLTFTVLPWLTAQDCAAMATVQVTPADCVDRNGVAVLTYANATVTAAKVNGLDAPVGNFAAGTYNDPPAGVYSLTLTASTGYVFEGEATTKVLEFTIMHKSALECSFPVPAVFSDYAPNPATCLAAGTLPPLETFPNVSLTFDRGFDGPGSYTLTATALNGYTFSDGTTVKTRVIVVAAKLTGEACQPLVATASIVVNPATCVDRDGSAVLAYANATVTAATLNGVVVST